MVWQNVLTRLFAAERAIIAARSRRARLPGDRLPYGLEITGGVTAVEGSASQQ